MCLISTHTAPHGQLHVHAPNGSKNEPLQRTSEWLQKLAALREIQRNNAKLNVHHCPKKNKREAVNMCPDYAVLREGIKLDFPTRRNKVE